MCIYQYDTNSIIAKNDNIKYNTTQVKLRKHTKQTRA